MGGQILVSFLISGVLGDEVEVFSPNDDGAVHLGGDNGSVKNSAADGDKAGEGALFIFWNEKSKDLSG